MTGQSSSGRRVTGKWYARWVPGGIAGEPIESGKLEWRELLDGKRVVLQGWEHLDLVMHPRLDGQGLQIFEGTTGFLLASGWTEEEVCAKCLKCLEEDGREVIDHLLPEIVREMGLSPRYTGTALVNGEEVEGGNDANG